jgi:putative restriction endonuclease
VNRQAVRSLKATHRARGLDAFKRALRPMLDLPPDRRDRPARRFVEMANQLRGW